MAVAHQSSTRSRATGPSLSTPAEAESKSSAAARNFSARNSHWPRASVNSVFASARQPRRVHGTQGRLRFAEVMRVVGLPEAFDVGAGDDQAGLVDGLAGLPGLGGRLDRQLVEFLVVEFPGVVGAAGRLGWGRPGQQTRGERESDRSHALMLLQGQSAA